METKTLGVLGGVLMAAAVVVTVPVQAHHSFAVYDAEKTVVFTGVVTRVNPDANHLQIFFAPMNEERNGVQRGPDGKPIIWAVEMEGSAQAATNGISVSTFPPGTIFSVGLHPLRSGEPAGAKRDSGAIFKCPEKTLPPPAKPERTPPPPGKHCDSVDGHQELGPGGPLPKAN